jgi:toxin FitB
MILLDANVVSELMRPAPDAGVLARTKAQANDELATSVLTVAEIGAGLACLPAGARRRDLVARWSRPQDDGFGERIFSLDHVAATVYGELFAHRQRAGRAAAAFDLLIFHHRVQTTGFQPVSFSSKMRHRRCRAWTTGMEVIRSIRSSTTSYG